MALLLVFGGVSKEYLHMFTGHTDTVHTHDDSDGLFFEKEHHHCDFLAFTLPPYANDAQSFFIAQRVYDYPQHTAVGVTHLIPRSLPASSMRGPPVYTA